MDEKTYRRKVWKLRALITISVLVSMIGLCGIGWVMFSASGRLSGMLLIILFAVPFGVGGKKTIFQYFKLEELHKEYRYWHPLPTAG